MSAVNDFNIYIPRIHVNWGRQAISSTFHLYFDLSIYRIDFVPIIVPQKEGENKSIEERTNKKFRSAFIFGTAYHPVPFHALPDKGLKIYVSNNKSVKTGDCEYWLCLPNKNPIDHNAMAFEEIEMNLNVLSRQIATDEEQEIYNYLVKNAYALENATSEYMDSAPMNQFQLSNNIKMMFKRVSERLNAVDA